MGGSRHVSVAQGLVVLATLAVLQQGSASLMHLWRISGSRAAPAAPVCALPVAVQMGQSLRLGCADESAVRACAAKAYDRVRPCGSECTVVSAGMPVGWYAVLGLLTDVNRAQVQDLQALGGVGPGLARAIVAHRQQHGPFKTVEALRDVHGVGPAKVATLGHLVMVGD